MRMMWLFIVLGVSGVIAVLAILAMYARVRRHLKAPGASEETRSETHRPEL
jgi:hypothetical protein